MEQRSSKIRLQKCVIDEKFIEAKCSLRICIFMIIIIIMFANNLTPININISKEMMTNIKFARQRYIAALGERKKLQIVDLKSRKRKQLAEEIEVMSNKKEELISSIKKDMLNDLINLHFRLKWGRTFLFYLCRTH